MKHKTTFTIGQQVWFMLQNKIQAGTVYRIVLIKDEHEPDGIVEVFVSFTELNGQQVKRKILVDCLFKSIAKLVKYLTAIAQ